MSTINAAITCVGGYLPEYVMTNAELEKIVDMGKCVEGFMLRFNIATAFDCPFEGRVLEQTVQDIIAQAVDLDFPSLYSEVSMILLLLSSP